MEKKTKITDELKRVLSSQLLSPTLSELAATLGYKGRATMYRIFKDEASSKAIDGLLRKLSDTLLIDEDSILTMSTTVQNTYYFSQLIGRNAIDSSADDFPFLVLNSFVSRDYSLFRPEFATTDLHEILLLKQEDPEAFYNMLAYFYLKNPAIQFYRKGLTHKERCASIIEPLGERFISLYPENTIASAMVYSYSNSDIYNSELPILWSLVQSVSAMLRYYGDPKETISGIKEIRLLPGLFGRNYWEGSDRDTVIISLAVRYTNNETAARYDIFKYSRKTGHIRNIGFLSFLSDSLFIVRLTGTEWSQFGMYTWNNHELTFQWEKPDDNPTGLGNRWTLLDPACSQSLREIDKSLPDATLHAERIKRCGFIPVPGFEVIDVAISRSRFCLILNNGRRYSIEISQARFIKGLHPNEPVQIYEHIEDNEMYVFWPDIMHYLPLSSFTKEQPEENRP